MARGSCREPGSCLQAREISSVLGATLAVQRADRAASTHVSMSSAAAIMHAKCCKPGTGDDGGGALGGAGAACTSSSTTMRTRWLLTSAKKSLPGAQASFLGLFNMAEVLAMPLPKKPAVPLPARVSMTPVWACTFLILLLPGGREREGGGGGERGT